MSLKSENVVIDGTTYQINELPVKVLLPLANRLSDSDATAQIEMIGKAVTVGSQPLGEGAGELGLSVYMKLIPLVLKINGMTGGELGNES